jgi:hypothetical protein
MIDLYNSLISNLDYEDNASTPNAYRSVSYITAYSLLAENKDFIDMLTTKMGAEKVKLLYRRVGYGLHTLYSSRRLDNYDPRLVLKFMKNVQALLHL